MGNWYSCEELGDIKPKTDKKEHDEINKQINNEIVQELFKELKKKPIFVYKSKE